MRRPQNLKKYPTYFDSYLVTPKQVGDFFSNFGAFSDNLSVIPRNNGLAIVDTTDTI